MKAFRELSSWTRTQARELARELRVLFKWWGRGRRRGRVALKPVPTSACAYRRLGLLPHVHDQEVHAAYRAVKTADLSARERALVDAAYQLLSDPSRREIYRLVRAGLQRQGLPIWAAAAPSRPRAAKSDAATNACGG